ncbi:MAG: hypothetical protein R3D60_03080 [Paracoccaceae bacterium]
MQAQLVCLGGTLNAPEADHAALTRTISAELAARQILMQIIGPDADRNIAGPAWFSEGIVRYLREYHLPGAFSRDMTADLRALLGSNTVAPLANVPHYAPPDSAEGLSAALAISELINRHDTSVLSALVIALGDGESFDTAFEDLTGQSPAEFEATLAP